MQLTVVGCSGTVPGPEAAASAYLVSCDGFRLLVDCGNGAIGALQRHVGLFDLDAVLITHEHADHCLDLIPYTYVRRHFNTGQLPPLPVFGPGTLGERLARSFETGAHGLDDVYDFRTLGEGRRTIGPFEVDTARVNHPVETYGVRLMADGVTVAYSADSGPTDALVDLARNADLLLCEASFLDGPGLPSNLHLTAREAGEHAARAEVRRLVLTHLVPWNDAARSQRDAEAAYGSRVELARAGATYDLVAASHDIPSAR